MFASVLTVLVAATAALSDISLNGSWEFRFEEGKSLETAWDAGFSATDVMSVPGCYDAMPKWLMKRGTGLYRRVFTLERDVDAAALAVDGMGLVGRFALDGRDLGTVALPWSRFTLPAGALKAGRHEIVAALDNRFDWKTLKLARPYYDFYCYGGFYHGVSLVLDSRRLKVRTRDYETGLVELEAVGFAADDFAATAVFDGTNGVKVAFAGGRAEVKVPGFRLWSPEAPNLHTVELDGVSARFGIRTVEAKAKRLWLNGKLLALKGVNRHESHPTFGAATPEQVMLADIQNLKSLGGNFIRGAHYPQAQRFLDLCDENGVLVWEEALGWGNGQDYTDRAHREFADPQFLEDNIRQVRLMVENSFNHPSVIVFAFMNEFKSSDPKGKEIADALIREIRAADSGRLVTFACNCTADDISNAETDLIAFNTYPGWIGTEAGDSENLRKLFCADVAKIVKGFRKRYGEEKPIMVSEMGTCAVYGHHDPAAAQWTEEFEAEYLAAAMTAVWAEPELAGFTIWQMNDAKSYHRDGGSIRAKPFAENLAGLYDGYRRAKLPVTNIVRRFFALPAAWEK